MKVGPATFSSLLMIAPITASSHTHMGTPLPGYQNEWVIHTVHVHDFASLLTVRGVYVDSPEFMLLGNPWRLGLFPGGHVNAAEGMVTLDLCNMSNKSIDIGYGFSVNDKNGKQVAYEQSNGPFNFAPGGDDDGDDCWGFIVWRWW